MILTIIFSECSSITEFWVNLLYKSNERVQFFLVKLNLETI